MNFIFEMLQENRIRAAQESAEQAADKVADVVAGKNDLQRRIEILALTNQALFEILKARLGITEAEVLERMAEIDGRDGQKDGMMAARTVSCRKCGRKVSTARRTCMFCGNEVPEGHLFGKT